MRNKLGLALVASAALTGCNATSNTSFRERTFVADRDSAILVDAKQRAILTRVYQENNQDPAKVRRFCAEPSPDFVSVMAQSLSAGGTFGRSADPASLEIAAQLAFSRAENGTTIARTQTINMLRELMYRTCERFLSGGYDEMELSIQAVRDQRLMVSILAIEQLTGAVAPTPTVISVDSSSSAGLGEEAIKTFDKLRDQKRAAGVAENLAQEAHDKEWKSNESDSDKPCDANKVAYDAEEDKSKLDAAVREKKVECDGLKTTLVSAKATTKEAMDSFNTVQTAMTTGGVSASTVSEAIANGGLNRATTQATKDVASTVKDIVELNFDDQTETMLFCLRALKDYAQRKGIFQVTNTRLNSIELDPLVSECLKFLDRDIQTAAAISEANRLEAEAQRAEAERRAREAAAALEALDTAENARFNTLWEKLTANAADGQYPGNAVSQLVGKLLEAVGNDIPPSDNFALAAMRGAKSKDVLRNAFGKLNDDYEVALLELEQ
uniref:hypothetical protein n=1 Tax=uncultured Altererythrobacter sp. TaxID=500840 RepID=UPI00262514F0|nr:hypothetical protein [uncultured Altererythrobacter sp.]